MNKTNISQELLTKLNPEQREAVLHTEGPLLILAGAGTGKTRVITYRIAHLLSIGVHPREILAVTFTNKAAAEMKNRVIQLAPEAYREIWVSTFHSFCAQVLRIESKHAGLKPEFVIYDETDQKNLIKECIRDLSLDEKKYNVGLCKETISRAKDELIDAESYMIHSATTEDPFRKIIANIYSLYHKRLIQNNAVDFGDLILKVVELFRTNEIIAQKYQNRFKYVLVDEYQDTNHAQHALIKTLVASHRNVCVVGDDDQSIYSWRGAQVRNILEFEREFKNTKIVKLEQNYRSTQNILTCAWGVIKNNQYRKEKKLWTERKAGDDIVVKQFNTELEEASTVVSRITALCSKRDCKYNDFAIFYRTNAQSRVFEDALRREKVPYVIIGSMVFYERMEIKDIMAYLKVIINPADSINLKRIVNVPHRNIGDKTVQVLEDLSKEKNVTLWEVFNGVNEDVSLSNRIKSSITVFVKLINKLKSARDEVFSLTEYVKFVIKQTGYIESLEAQANYESIERIKNLQELVSAVNEFETGTESPTLESFISTISLAAGIDSWDNDRNYVTLMTMHMAKGLEFPVVFVTGLEDGLFPLSQTILGDDIKELEEERRLCYVGMTRAKESLYLTYSNTRRLYGKIRNNIPSRFLHEAQRTLVFSPPVTVENVRAEGPFNFDIGDKVSHNDFGEGQITNITGAGEDVKVTIMFDNGQWKKLYAKYANLVKI